MNLIRYEILNHNIVVQSLNANTIRFLYTNYQLDKVFLFQFLFNSKCFIPALFKSNDSLKLMLLTQTCHKFGENCHLFVRNFFYVEEKAGDYFDQHPFHSGSRNNLK